MSTFTSDSAETATLAEKVSSTADVNERRRPPVSSARVTAGVYPRARWTHSTFNYAGSMPRPTLRHVSLRRRERPGRPSGYLERPAHRHKAARLVVRGVVKRRWMDDALDRLRLRLDMFPAGVYQPVPTLPFRHATRARGSESRWAAMSPLIQSLAPRQAVDVGADAGYFALQLGWLGVPTVAMDGDPRAQRTAMLAVRRSGLHTVAVTSLRLEPANVGLVPPADCVLVLSVWHHFVRDHGLEAATTMVQSIWAKTGKVMLFDTGESEMPPSFGLPAMVPDGRTWLRDYLAHACAGSRIEHLGRHAAFDAEGEPCERNLFAVVRIEDRRRPG